MTLKIIVTGTDTGIGKTVFAAGLTRLLDGCYWKPVQAGLGGESDSAVVRRLSGLPADRVLPEAWALTTPASPHLAAERDGVVIDPAMLSLPSVTRPLVIEGAGGLMVPLTRKVLLIDIFAGWGVPVVLCARTGLGTLNHTLLSLEALRRRGVSIVGVALIKAQVDALDQVIFAEFTHEPAESLARELVAIAPKGLQHVFFSDSGSTSVEVALKMALGFWRYTGAHRYRVMRFEIFSPRI